MLTLNVNVWLLAQYNSQAVAITAVSDQLLQLGLVAMGIVSLGSTIIFIQYADMKYLGKIQSAIRVSMTLNVFLAICIASVMVVGAPFFVQWIQTPVHLQAEAVLYLRWVSGGLLFQGSLTAISALMRSFGRVKEAMGLTIITTILVISANAFVVFGLKEWFDGSLLGVGLATLIGRGLGAIVGMLALYRYLPQLIHRLWVYKKKDKEMARRILALGIPSAMENISYNFSQVLITATIAGLGVTSLTAKVYSQTLAAATFTIAIAGGQALQVVIGQLVRQDQSKDAHDLVIEVLKWFLAATIGLGIIIALTGSATSRLFTAELEVLKIVRALLWLSVIYEPLRLTNEMLIASLQVLGEVRYPVRLGVLVTYLFTVPAVFFLGQSIYIIWVIFILDEGYRAWSLYRRWQEMGGERLSV